MAANNSRWTTVDSFPTWVLATFTGLNACMHACAHAIYHCLSVYCAARAYTCMGPGVLAPLCQHAPPHLIWGPGLQPHTHSCLIPPYNQIINSHDHNKEIHPHSKHMSSIGSSSPQVHELSKLILVWVPFITWTVFRSWSSALIKATFLCSNV